MAFSMNQSQKTAMSEINVTPLVDVMLVLLIIFMVTAVQEDALPEKILEATKENPTREVYLRADKSVPYGTVVRIMAALKGAGIANLGMITTPKQDSSGPK